MVAEGGRLERLEPPTLKMQWQSTPMQKIMDVDIIHSKQSKYSNITVIYLKESTFYHRTLPVTTAQLLFLLTQLQI